MSRERHIVGVQNSNILEEIIAVVVVSVGNMVSEHPAHEHNLLAVSSGCPQSLQMRSFSVPLLRWKPT